jgi:hypothetical protein
MEEVDWLVQQVHSRRVSNPPPKTVGDLLERSPQQVASEAIDRFYDAIWSRLGKFGLDSAIAVKVARACQQGRIAEANLFRWLDSVAGKGNPGAYFVVCAKKGFADVGLSWLEEEWT